MATLRAVWSALPLRRKVLSVVAIPIVPLVLTGVVSYFSYGAGARAQADVTRTWRIRMETADSFSMLADAESAVRGYLLTGNAEWLRPFHDAQSQIPRALDRLNADITDSFQRQHLGELRRLANDRLRALDVLSKEGRSSTPGATGRAMAAIAEGKVVMDAAREHVRTMQRREGDLLDTRLAVAQAMQRRESMEVVLGVALGLVGGVAAALLFSRGITRRVEQLAINADRLARGRSLLPTPDAADELGTLARGIRHASTLLKEREYELYQRVEELSAVNAELNAFTYSVSHDLRAPLRHIAGFAALLEKSSAASLSDQGRRHLRTISEAAARMGRLIDELLVFSRTGRTELVKVRVDLSKVLEEAKKELEPEWNGREVVWSIEPLPEVEADHAMMRLVFTNLLSNALKYSSKRSRAEIAVGTLAAPAGEVGIFVRDNGVGFDMKYAHKLFGVFQRLHRTEDFDGTGIGLANVRRIVTRHGGRVWGEGSTSGATFFVALPMGDAGHALRETDPADPDAGAPGADAVDADRASHAAGTGRLQQA